TAYTQRLRSIFFFFQAEDGIRDRNVTGVQTCALPIFQLARVPFVDAAPRHAEGLPILQTDGIDEHELLDLLRMEQRVSDGEHSARGMSEQRDPPDAEMLQERARVRRQLLEAVLVALRLARLAETDLIGRDDAPAGLAQRPDGGLPGSGAEVLSVQQHDRPSVGALWSDVEVAHVQLLPLRLQIEALDGPRVIEAFELGPVCDRGRTHRSGSNYSEENQGQAADDHLRLIAHYGSGGDPPASDARWKTLPKPANSSDIRCGVFGPSPVALRRSGALIARPPAPVASCGRKRFIGSRTMP